MLLVVFLLDDSGTLQSAPSLDFLKFEHIRGLMMGVCLTILVSCAIFATRSRLIGCYGQLCCLIELVIGVGRDTLRDYFLLLRYDLRIVLHGALLERILHFPSPIFE